MIFLASDANRTLHAGDLVDVQWTGLPRDAEEMELLLSVDDGRHFAVRLTPDLEADRKSYAWRVPPFESAAARLAVRANLDGREVLIGVSDRFRILAGDVAGADARPLYRWPMRARDGELWVTGDEIDGRDEAPLELPAAASGRHLAAWWTGVVPAVPSSSRVLPRRPAPSLASVTDSGPHGVPAPNAPGRRMLISPLRI